MDEPKGIFQSALIAAKEQGDLNSFISMGEFAQDVSDGPLSGLVIGVKDNIHVAGIPNSARTKTLESFVPPKDATVIARLKAAGAMILGKTNMHEMAFGVTSNNAGFGAIRNPYNLTKFAGGSSGGSAAAVAARIVPAALGTDTGGSMRMPAAHCGVIGFRPSIGRYPMDGTTPVSHTRDMIGPMALKMADVIKLDQAMAGSDQDIVPADLNSLRLGVARDPFFRNLNSETARITDEALGKLAVAGVTLVEKGIPELAALNDKASFPIALYEAVQALEKYLAEYDMGQSFFDLAEAMQSPDVQAMFADMAKDENGDGHPDGVIPEAVYQEALHHRAEMQALYRAYFAEHAVDALVFPTTILPAGPIEGTMETIEHNGEQCPIFPTYVQNTDPGSVTGIPGITLPSGLTEQGLPVGLALDAVMGNDERLLSIALSIEALFGQLPPPSTKTP